MNKLFNKTLSFFIMVFSFNLTGQEPIIIAHRGNSSEAPENTFAAFKSAADNQFPFIECDIHLTKDGVPVVIHDRHLNRTSDHPMPEPVEKLLLSEIKRLDCGKWYHPSFTGEKILTLKELLEAPLQNIGLMIEIKDGSASDHELTYAVLEEVKKYQLKNQNRPIIIGSMSSNIIKLLRKDAPDIKTIAITENHEALQEHLQNEPEFIAAYKGIIDEEMVRRLQTSGKKVWVWTVDSPEDIHYSLKCNVDGIITNEPKSVKKITTLK